LWGASDVAPVPFLKQKGRIMKITRAVSSLFALTLCLAVLASASFATNKPLDNPEGLAVDAKGNIYVANSLANNVLIYNSSYVQQTSKTITQGINRPSAVAIDPYGNLWIGNYGSSAITEYTAGVHNTSATITHAITKPTAIAIDGLDNLWVVNNEGSSGVTIYNPATVYAPPSHLARTISPGVNIYGIAVGAAAFAYSSDTVVPFNAATAALLGGPLQGGYGIGGTALAPDNSGDIYFVGSDHNVYLAHPNDRATVFVTLPSTAGIQGMAVDNVKKRVYMSDTLNNQIFVYSTAGVLLETIHN
jgi:sugar lactone lactonase YvrE